MNVSRQFLRDFAYLANRYGWNAADIEEVKAHMREHVEPMRWYWTTLAAAHRAGYEQTKENGFIRLQAWCDLKGWKFDVTGAAPMTWHGNETDLTDQKEKSDEQQTIGIC